MRLERKVGNITATSGLKAQMVIGSTPLLLMPIEPPFYLREKVRPPLNADEPE